MQAAGASIVCAIAPRVIAPMIGHIVTGPDSAKIFMALMLCFPLIGIGCVIWSWMLLKRNHELRFGALALSLVGVLLNGGFLAGMIVPFLTSSRS